MSNIKTNQGDAVTLPRHRELSEEEMRENDSISISKHMLHLYWKEPFFHRVLQGVNLVKDRSIGTAGVGYQDGSLFLWWSPDFIASLSDDEIVGLLMHECGHIVYGHLTSKLKPPIVANWAMDLAINSGIPAKDLPKGGWIPGKSFDRPHPDDWAMLSDKEKARFEHLSKLVARQPVGKTHHFYYSVLMNDPLIAEMVKEQDMISSILAGLISLDDHSKMGELSPSDAQHVKGLTAEIVKSAIGEAERRGWGSVSSDTSSDIKALFSNEVSWQSLLRQFTGRCRKSTRRSSWSRRSRKQPGALPGRHYNKTSNIIVFVDESGSVSSEELNLLFGEMNSLAKHTSFDLVPFDTAVKQKHLISWEKGMKVDRIKRVQCGGTSFQCCFDFLEKRENRGKYDGAIILTDGGSSKPKPSRIRTAYVLVPGTSLAFEQHPEDIVIKMKK